MSDDEQPTDDDVRDTDDRLRTDASGVDTAAALRATQERRRPGALGLVIAGASAVVVLAVVGFFVLRDDGSQVVETATEDDTGEGGQPTATSARLVGTSWILVGGVGPEGPLVPVEAAPISIEFLDGAIRGDDSCNRFGYDLEIVGNRITLSDREGEEELCEPPVGAPSAEAFHAALEATEEIRLTDNDLTLVGPDVELLFRPGEAVDPPLEPADLELELAESSWVLVRGVGPDGEVPVTDAWPITLAFDAAGSLGGTAACNSYGGGYSIDGGRFVLGDIGVTEAACEEPAMTGERLYLGAFFAADSIDLVDGMLVLTGDTVELEFVAPEPVPTAALIGTVWVLDTLIEGEAASSTFGEPATLLLRADGTLEASTGCRTLSGEYVITGSEVVPTSFGAEGECPPDVARQDSHVITVLESGFMAEVLEDRLFLTAAGDIGLVYRASDIAPSAEPQPADDEPDDPGPFAGGSGFDAVPCFGSVPVDLSLVPAVAVDGIESFDGETCRRTVFHLVTDGGEPANDGGQNLPVIPSDLPGVAIGAPTGFQLDQDALLDTSVGVAGVVQDPAGAIFLFVDHGPGETRVGYWGDRIAVDTRLSGPPPPTVVGEAILSRPIPAARQGTAVVVRGLARPFEATGSVSLRTATPGTRPGSGDLVEATWSGFEVLGDGHVGPSYGFMTAGIDTWGEFEIVVEGLPAGTYELLFEAFAPEESGSPGTYVTFVVQAAPLVLATDGLAVVDDAGASTTLLFGTGEGVVNPAIEGALGVSGEPGEVGVECPNQLDAVITYGEISIDLRDGSFISWTVDPDSDLRTAEGVGVGSTRAELEAAYPDVEIFESTLGTELRVDQMGGLLTDGAITNLWAGQICAYR